MLEYIVIGLFLLIIFQQMCIVYERKRYIKIIEQLTDKILAKDYRDYVWGQDMKEGETTQPAYRPRSDEMEARIEEENKKAEELMKKAGVLTEKMERKKMEPTS